MKTVRAHFKKNTYWNIIRADRGIKLVEVAEYMKTTPAIVGGWFTGASMPTTEQATQICEFFDVPAEKGTSEFEKAHKEWLKRKREYTEKYAPKQKNKTEPATTPATNNVFEMVYGVLSYAEFNAFFDACAGKEGDPLELIYGKVDLATYSKIANILKEG